MKRAELGLESDPSLLLDKYLGPCLALLSNPPRTMLEGHHAPCPEQSFSSGENTARVNKPSVCKESKLVKSGCWLLLFALGIRITYWFPASPLWKWSWPPLLLPLCPPDTFLFFSASFLTRTYMDGVTVKGYTHAHTPKERISEVNHLSIFSPFPAQPGSEWETNFVMAYLQSPPGLRRGGSSRWASGAGTGAASVNQQRSPCDRDAC